MQVRVLGCSGGIGQNLRTTSFLVGDNLLLDAGTGVGDLTLDEMLSLRYVLLTHAHLDHIAGLALMFASIYDEMTQPVIIYAPEKVLSVLKQHLFNWSLWPDFSQLPDPEKPTLQFQPLDVGKTNVLAAGITVTPVALSHTVTCYAYIIEQDNMTLCFCGDTGTTEELWQVINNRAGIDHIIIETSYLNEQSELANQSGHYTPVLLAQDLQKLHQKPTVHIQHIKPGNEHNVIQQCHDALSDFKINILAHCSAVELLSAGQIKISNTAVDYKNIEQHLSKLTDIGILLSSEQDNALLLEKILISAKDIANADGGTLYTLKDEKFLQMDIVLNDSMGIALGGSSSQASTFSPLPLFLENGEPNYTNVVACAIHEDIVIDIKDRHQDTRFDFTGAQHFDNSTGYKSISFLTIPMKNHKGEMIGALQLINALDDHNDIVPFSHQNILLVKALASQAAITLTNKGLIDELELLFESFIELLAGSIDEKSPYTGGHCRRVPELTIMLTEALHNNQQGPLQHFTMTEMDRYELKIAAWLHDCGKITTPEYIVDKATKLETIYDRINEVNARFETVRRDLEIKLLEQKVIAAESNSSLSDDVFAQHKKNIARINLDQAFINQHNTGGEFMTEDDQDQVVEIAQRHQITNYQNVTTNILTDNEIENMQISRGTLTHDERLIINKHIDVTINMLTALKLPKHLKNVPEIAGGHHERMDGKGYPKGLTREQMSIQTRAMGIADIFEALTAADRPYKKGKTISESLSIMKYMKDTNHIDADIFDIFIRDKIYLDYANKFLNDYQIDSINDADFLTK